MSEINGEVTGREFAVAENAGFHLPDHLIEVEKVGAIAPRPWYEFVKRLFDIAFAVIGLAVLILPMGVIALIVRATSKGGALYKQERLGLNGKPFMMYKFRSMTQDAEKDGAQWAKENDDRVTPIGRVLRATRLDELPQFFNILFGQMSVVGPRPERAVFYDIFEKRIHGFRQRLLVKPGLTGWAQINGGYELDPAEKIVYDIEYIHKRSFSMDMRCVLRTALTVLRREGAK